MTTVELARAAVEDLTGWSSPTAPTDTRQRVRATLSPLVEFPRLGPELGGHWHGMRFLLGPWRWMILVSTFEESHDRVVVATIQDTRSSSSPTMR